MDSRPVCMASAGVHGARPRPRRKKRGSPASDRASQPLSRWSTEIGQAQQRSAGTTGRPAARAGCPRARPAKGAQGRPLPDYVPLPAFRLRRQVEVIRLSATIRDGKEHMLGRLLRPRLPRMPKVLPVFSRSDRNCSTMRRPTALHHREIAQRTRQRKPEWVLSRHLQTLSPDDLPFRVRIYIVRSFGAT
jgi:hypothetical protein